MMLRIFPAAPARVSVFRILYAIALAGVPPFARAQPQPRPQEDPRAAEAREPQPSEEGAETTARQPGGETETTARQPGGEGETYRPLGPRLWPIYSHELRSPDQAEILQVLGLYSRTRRPDGSSSLLLLPFLYKRHQVDPPDDRLYLFPFYYQRTSPDLAYRYLLPLYFERRSPELTLRYILPFFADHRTPDFRMLSLFPFWVRLSTESGRLHRDYALFPLIKLTRDARVENRTVRSARFGIPYILELYERRATERTVDSTMFNFFNWSDEAQSGLSLFGHHWVEEEWGPSGYTYLVPFYYHGKGADSRDFWLFPLFGYSRDGAQQDYVLFPLLGRYGRGPGDALRLAFLFPFFSYGKGEDSYWLASYPFFDYYRDAESNRFGLLFWLYRYYQTSSGRRVHLALFPLAYFAQTADGSRGHRWVVPYFDFWSENWRYRILVPAYFRYDARAAGETTRYFSLALPSYISFGAPDDYFSMGLPLYWASREGDKGWQVFVPLYYNFYSRISRSLHLLPLFSYTANPASKQLYLLGPAYVYKQYYGLEEELSGTSHSILWPFFTLENRADGYSYRVLPFFWITRRGESRGLLISPFYYQYSAPQGTFHYIFPLYARFEAPRQVIDIRAGGAYVRQDTFLEEGRSHITRTNLLWYLATFEKNHLTRTSHQRILPLAFWRTAGPLEHRTIAGPFLYSHRLVENDEVHDLDLVLGNLFLSKTVSVPKATKTPEAAPPAPPPSSGGGAEPALPAAQEGPKPAALEVRSRDRGILWPLTRWYSKTPEGASGEWALPFYLRTRSPGESHLAIFPLYFQQRSESAYDPSYFRYFFLFDRETYAGGSRLTVGQILFDYYRNEQEETSRTRVLYPLLEVERGETRFTYQVTPLIGGETRLEGGERTSDHRIIPFFWKGSRERLSPTGEWMPESSHFFLFPLFGYEKKSTRADYHLLYPLMHAQTSPQSFRAELWPIFFYRDNPALRAVRFWPLHATETGETAGRFWVSKYLFFSKYFSSETRRAYRLDPFLFRTHSAPESFGIGGLFETLAYDRSGDKTSFRAIPLLFGYSDGDTSTTAFIPFHYRRSEGEGTIDYWDPWRFFFLTSFLRGEGGERHFSVLTKLFDYTYSTERPDYSEWRVLHQFLFYLDTETTTRVEWNPLFQYFEDREEGRTSLSVLFSLYQRETVGGETRQKVL